ncbi:MAG: hypothetical protein PHV07_05700 [Oscillospiraceae bacterium]|nr:hypothetical protein [Oscillospiraceae bacterium]
MRQGGGRRRAIARRERQRSLANKRPRRLVDFYLELVLGSRKRIVSCKDSRPSRVAIFFIFCTAAVSRH